MKLLRLVETFFSLSISNLSTLDFKLAKSIFLAISEILALVSFFKSDFVSYLDKSTSSFSLSSNDYGSAKYSLIYTISFFIT